MSFKVIQADVMDALSSVGEFDAVLCDPPYGLSFMGKAWDHGVPSVEVWAEVNKVLKPGAFLLAFGGTRTFHRLTCAIEDAGFEIRDCVSWLYGSGFPKSMDISKAMDKAAGVKREVVGVDPPRAARLVNQMGDYQTEAGWSAGSRSAAITAPATEAAQTWSGYGTALKPAWEPCIVAMKPLDGTFANNAIEHGVAGLNIEAGRVGTDTIKTQGGDKFPALYGSFATCPESTHTGRWPANLILDESFGQEWSRFFYCAKASRKERDAGLDERKAVAVHRYGAGIGGGKDPNLPAFNRNNHPCLKPLDLNRYLASMILPPRRTSPRRLLVPFSGSGSEMIGALQAGWDEVIGIEKEAEYVSIANARLKHWTGFPLLDEA